MDWEELAITSHYNTAVAIREALQKGHVDDASVGLEELIDALSRSGKAGPEKPSGAPDAARHQVAGPT